MMDWTDPHFAEPAWLWLAAVGPVLLLLIQWRSARARSAQIARVVSPQALGRLTRSHSRGRRLFKHLLLLFALACMGLALARPQWGQLSEKGRTLGQDVVFVLDCSQSMLASDVSPTRLDRAKLAILDFIKTPGLGRLSLVSFAGQAFIQCPLTYDYGAFQDSLNAVDEKTIPVLGTDIGRALDEASRAWESRKGLKITVLITDGEDLEKGALRVAEQLGKEGLVVFTVGVGTPAGSEVRVPDERGKLETLRDKTGQTVVSHLDETTLRKIALLTGGEYHPLGSMGEGLLRVGATVRDKASRLGLAPAKKLGVDRFHWPLALAVVLLGLESLVGTRHVRRDRIPGS